MFRLISVPLDGSAAAEAALPFALKLARDSGARVELLHVHRPHRPGERLEALPVYGWQQIVAYDNDADTDAADVELERFGALARDLSDESGVPIVVSVIRGDVAASVVAHTRAAGADLIVMATHGNGGLMRAWLGSVADAVVRRSEIPVLLVRPGETALAGPEGPEIRTVLVALDGSEFSEAVLDPVSDVALATGADLTLLRVLRPGELPSFLERNLPVSPEAYLERIAAALPPDVDVTGARVIVDPAPAFAILDEVEEHGYSMVAMATHGHGNPRSILLGSTAERVLRGTRRPLLLYRPPVSIVQPVSDLEEIAAA